MPINNTKALTVASVVDSLIGGFRSHLLGRSLPAPAYVELEVPRRRVSVQPQCGPDLAEDLAILLLWAHSLDEVTAEWSRTSADRLHVSVDGRTSGGLRMRIYTGDEFSQTAGLVRLEPDESEIVTLDELYTLVGLLREAQEHPRGVA